MFLFNPEDPGSVKTLLDVHHGNFVGVAVLAPGNDLCVVIILIEQKVIIFIYS